ncbi:MAG: transposase [Clostridiales bacterium]|nr:transposase [Clostridiales bacterium]
MSYSYEYKLKCVEIYKEGRWPETPEGIMNRENFRKMIRKWVRIEEANGPYALKHRNQKKKWSPDERLELVAKVIAGSSVKSVAINAGINNGMLGKWVQKYKCEGYNGLVDKKKGRPPKEPQMKKLNRNKPRKLKKSEYEELIRLRAENEYIKAENEVIKKEIALREEKEAARLKAKKQRSSKNSEKKDIP